MISFEDYIDSSLAGIAKTELLLEFRNSLMDEMTDRANSLVQKGLEDEKVIDELIISEYPDLKLRYKQLLREEKAKRRAKALGALAVVGSAAYTLLITTIYLAVSFTTKRWDITWLIMVGGIFAALFAGIFICAKRSVRKKGIFRPLSRILLAVGVFIVATFVFLCLQLLTDVASAWLVFPVGVIAALFTDSVYAAVTKQRLAVINYMVYLPVAAAIAYLISGITGIVSWHPGWLMIIAAIMIDLFIIMGLIINNSKYMNNGEVLDLWNED